MTPLLKKRKKKKIPIPHPDELLPSKRRKRKGIQLYYK